MTQGNKTQVNNYCFPQWWTVLVIVSKLTGNNHWDTDTPNQNSAYLSLLLCYGFSQILCKLYIDAGFGCLLFRFKKWDLISVHGDAWNVVTKPHSLQCLTWYLLRSFRSFFKMRSSLHGNTLTWQRRLLGGQQMVINLPPPGAATIGQWTPSVRLKSLF